MISHFIYYPKTHEGEFISLTLMNYGEVLDKSKEWDRKVPYIAENELFINSDLTESDIAIR